MNTVVYARRGSAPEKAEHDEKKSPHYIISRNDSYFKILFGLLSSKYSVEFQSRAWKILLAVPSNHTLVTKCTDPEKIEWESWINGCEPFQLLNAFLSPPPTLRFAYTYSTPLLTISISMFILQQCIHLRISFNILSLNGNLKRQMEICTMSYGCDSCDRVMLRIQNNLFTHSLTTFLFVP